MHVTATLADKSHIGSDVQGLCAAATCTTARNLMSYCRAVPSCGPWSVHCRPKLPSPLCMSLHLLGLASFVFMPARFTTHDRWSKYPAAFWGLPMMQDTVTGQETEVVYGRNDFIKIPARSDFVMVLLVASSRCSAAKLAGCFCSTTPGSHQPQQSHRPMLPEDVVRLNVVNQTPHPQHRVPHLFEFLEDNYMIEWWDCDFRAWFYKPYRDRIAAAFASAKARAGAAAGSANDVQASATGQQAAAQAVGKQGTAKAAHRHAGQKAEAQQDDAASASQQPEAEGRAAAARAQRHQAAKQRAAQQKHEKQQQQDRQLEEQQQQQRQAAAHEAEEAGADAGKQGANAAAVRSRYQDPVAESMHSEKAAAKAATGSESSVKGADGSAAVQPANGAQQPKVGGDARAADNEGQQSVAVRSEEQQRVPAADQASVAGAGDVRNGASDVSKQQADGSARHRQQQGNKAPTPRRVDDATEEEMQSADALRDDYDQ